MRKPILATLLGTFIFVLIVAATHGGCVGGTGNPQVTTYDENGEPCDTFNVGDKVNITSYSDPCYGDYEVIVTDPDGNVRFQLTVTGGGRYTVVLDDITDKLGWWEVKAGSTTTHYASAYYNVIPEVPLGAASVVTAGFTYLGLARYKLRRRRKE